MASKSPAKRRARVPQPLDERSLPSAEQAWQLIAILVVAVIVAASTLKICSWIGGLYLPFCDTNSGSFENCIPCPEHGICKYGQLECLTGFRRRGKHCVEDSLIEKSAEKLAGLMMDHICTINGQSVCDGGTTVWLSEGEILDAMTPVTSKLQGPTLWLVQEKAIGIASHWLETKIHGVRVFCCPADLVDAYKPFGCRLREWLFKNFLKLLMTIPVLYVSASFVIKYWRYKSRLNRAEELYAQVCEALEAKATQLGSSPGSERWIVASRLRDHLLRPSERRNRALWLEVERLVLEDSRIDQHPKLVRGESRIVWEWQIEGSLSPATIQGKARPRVASPSSSPPGSFERFDYFPSGPTGNAKMKEDGVF
ncbi:uncharacterized protein LOC112346419 [Selaginella moellendorffii]|uniref:uncharacterized protein LOC112346419 n=1 Tax=Selaginella moellendorffii TaxID=88036 RepID=UPI000D1D011B|nr:uncharacterized protein LOC112346419 [Selaginella moellendorffii]|eukprot:XP_024531141.1 uncharacterized protein LOC112346419 [Selaginella moellendorffii]